MIRWANLISAATGAERDNSFHMFLRRSFPLGLVSSFFILLILAVRMRLRHFASKYCEQSENRSYGVFGDTSTERFLRPLAGAGTTIVLR